MTVRTRSLPVAWYPGSSEEIESFAQISSVDRGIASACLAPHAGWFFSGDLAIRAIASLSPDVDTIAVCGGHLGPGEDILCASEEAIETPIRTISVDLELRSALNKGIDVRDDFPIDNTVEIQMPLVALLFPHVKVLWYRLPADMRSFDFGTKLAAISQAAHTKVAVIGSSDLTHYGKNYGFKPKGAGAEALEWVSHVNDKRFIDAALALSPEAALTRSLEERSACSPGGVLAAMGFAKSVGALQGDLLAYATSAEKQPNESFVGYAALSWSLPH